ncbi:hypothetical protein GCM10009555_080300 [Acrocarpospora macrocephala]|uniref:Abortive infection protein n=1 Tax=Acrocarpospora macrocephala TaxID=150177 RepID=A0A5M3WSA3_9ACTN|nr:hypothetical protein [Acrocarpospora macrocephala]GES10191.1 hypothetical protein Amac_037880 [Acrocarpospora macrocephala]
MRARGINYDTGFLPGDSFSRRHFDPRSVQHDIDVIAGELHCDAIRISGREPDRLTLTAELAAAAGLEIWFAPFPVDLPPDEMLSLFADCAQRAESIRRSGARISLVTGCEISAFGSGFIPGATFQDRMQTMATADLSWWQSLGPVLETLNDFLAQAATTSRAHFNGPITYASGPWEFIDWTPFDVVGVDAYRAGYNAETFPSETRAHHEHGKPVAVLEFGTCAYQGASDLGGMAWQPPANAVPDESEQTTYYTELMAIFEQESIDTALWFTFAAFNLTNEADIASYGVVKMLDETKWRPKALFHTMAAYNRSRKG